MYIAKSVINICRTSYGYLHADIRFCSRHSTTSIATETPEKEVNYDDSDKDKVDY